MFLEFGSVAFRILVGGVWPSSRARSCESLWLMPAIMSLEEGGVGQSEGGDREPTELRLEVNSEELELFMVIDGARVQENNLRKDLQVTSNTRVRETQIVNCRYRPADIFEKMEMGVKVSQICTIARHKAENRQE